MSKKLLQGAANALVDEDGKPIQRVLFGATWTDVSFDIDMCALFLTRGGAGYQVATEQHFIYRQRRSTPEKSAFLAYLPPGQSVGPDRAQIMIDFGALPREVSRVLIAMSAQQPGSVLRSMGTLRTRAMDMTTGETRLVYQHGNPAQLDAACITLWTLDRVGSLWTGKINVTPYPGGPPALVRDHGARTS